ncbi:MULTISPECIES: GNAT family N-acetyltransferase [Methanothrix]|jgi:acyl-CoA hydrolase/ribosomal protein S18 acetylase RimI-like enzyme|uniref:Acetyl-CoA hydrolase/N-acetyltransferase GNAT family fusion protein n=3 Tax=root TaxID=1 RepID=F4C0W0_METSG|nr:MULTISPECIES: GNAT family N-acetyltransferase [Methanothrix]AEB69298.1 acetyl-CoA hydrolase/N-acetyltransferase GNAT family fusion protein [Methanothrix soehngenii GP6]HNQ53139.1 GNAT family N-acetyltransferase [Methanothrix soehngenii]HNT46934.1 GNAT family N-acetyltransferase [Methanothrix soehngenii]HOC66040.1 GNAT family N-acetyltransferase [Methanothrix soehngenii]HOI20461.1 GNAT family N-acetyltransferase [Methanothrix soehngenii]
MKDKKILEEFKKTYPEKFLPPEVIFSHIHAGDRIFIGTGCGEPQFLVAELVNYVNNNPKAFFDAELIHIWTLGVAPYTDEKFQDNFRLDSFFVGDSTRNPVNRGAADYTPIFLSSVPDLFRSEMVPVDIALVQTSLPDKHGYLSLGISVDVVKAALEKAEVVVAQVNENMPRTHGDGFIHIKDIDFILPHDEPLLEYSVKAPNDIVQRIGKYVARIIEDGSTIQVGYGLIPDEVVHSLENKKDLGVHTELLSDGIVELMKKGVVTNQKKIHNPGKTIASFCMGSRDTYDFLDENPSIEFKRIDYTNNPLIISRNRMMTAINSAMEVDLTGQATAESLGGTFYSGTGGQADFMRGAVLSPGGKTILAFPSTALNDSVSRIVPVLQEGAGITLTRGDVHYMVTEYGIAYLHGKNIRERAMDLIAIAHPKFRPWLIEAARKRSLIYKDQVFIPGEKGMYPEELETYRTTKKGLEIFLRPVKITDETMLKDFFYDLSEDSMYMRFFSARKDMPHKRLQDFVVVDWSRKMEILAVIKEKERERETIIALGQYELNPDKYLAEVAIVVKDEYHGMGVGKELLSYLTYIARRHGLLGFTADTLVENKAMVSLFEKMGFYTEKRREEGVYEMKMLFRKSKEQNREDVI